MDVHPWSGPVWPSADRGGRVLPKREEPSRLQGSMHMIEDGQDPSEATIELQMLAERLQGLAAASRLALGLSTGSCSELSESARLLECACKRFDDAVSSAYSSYASALASTRSPLSPRASLQLAPPAAAAAAEEADRAGGWGCADVDLSAFEMDVADPVLIYV